MKTRKAAVAGTFYPGGKEELNRMIKKFMEDVPSISLEKPLKALIVPHAGYVYSGQVAAYAYSLLSNEQRIILLGPSHYDYFDGFAGDVNDFWATPLGRVRLAGNDFPKFGEAHATEHSLEVQVPFLQRKLGDFEMLPLLTGRANPVQVSEALLKMVGGSLLIASSDLSHYHPYDDAVCLDRYSINAILSLDYDKLAEGEACGKIPVLTLIDIAKKLGWKCKLLTYRNSGDTAGDKSRVVGYASLAFC